MKIGDEVYVHGYVDEIRNDVVIIRNDGGYFGTVPSEMFYYEEDRNGYGTMNEADTPQADRQERVTADDRWTWNFDVYDESDAPTKEGYYRTIDDGGNETTDYYFNEPRMTHHGIGYWKYGARPIIAWKYLGDDTADTLQDERNE